MKEKNAKLTRISVSSVNLKLVSKYWDDIDRILEYYDKQPPWKYIKCPNVAWKENKLFNWWLLSILKSFELRNS